jgi:flagellar basal-body rod protein FlgB
MVNIALTKVARGKSKTNLSLMRDIPAMDFTNTPLLAGLEARMRHAQSRQQVIAQNIAHADTPGYKARTLAEPDFSAVLSAVDARGAGRVAKPQIAMPAAFKTFGSTVAMRAASEVDEKAFETKPNGNNVSLEEQLSALSNVQMEYAEMTNLYRKQMGMFRIALGKGR